MGAGVPEKLKTRNGAEIDIVWVRDTIGRRIDGPQRFAWQTWITADVAGNVTVGYRIATCAGAPWVAQHARWRRDRPPWQTARPDGLIPAATSEEFSEGEALEAWQTLCWRIDASDGLFQELPRETGWDPDAFPANRTRGRPALRRDRREIREAQAGRSRRSTSGPGARLGWTRNQLRKFLSTCCRAGVLAADEDTEPGRERLLHLTEYGRELLRRTAIPQNES